MSGVSSSGSRQFNRLLLALLMVSIGETKPLLHGDFFSIKFSKSMSKSTNVYFAGLRFNRLLSNLSNRPKTRAKTSGARGHLFDQNFGNRRLLGFFAHSVYEGERLSNHVSLGRTSGGNIGRTIGRTNWRKYWGTK